MTRTDRARAAAANWKAIADEGIAAEREALHERGGYHLTWDSETSVHVWDIVMHETVLTFGGPDARALATAAIDAITAPGVEDEQAVIDRWLPIARVSNGQHPTNPDLDLT